MQIDAKLPEGYVVLCGDRHDGHSFLVGNLGIAVECPHCGNAALSVDLARDFARRQEADSAEAAA